MPGPTITEVLAVPGLIAFSVLAYLLAALVFVVAGVLIARLGLSVAHRVGLGSALGEFGFHVRAGFRGEPVSQESHSSSRSPDP